MTNNGTTLPASISGNALFGVLTIQASVPLATSVNVAAPPR
jgi:hypothetical protein